MVAKLSQAKATTKILALNLGAVSSATVYVDKLPLCVVLSRFYKVWADRHPPSVYFIYKTIFIYSFWSLSYDRFITSATARSPQSASYCFLFQFPVSYLFPNVVQQLLTPSFSSLRHSSPSLYFPPQ